MRSKAVFAASLLAVGVAFAGETDLGTSATIGVMPLAISGTNVIINIPWVEAGSSGGGVAVSNLVKTAGLGAGDNLLWYSPSDAMYRIWRLTEHAGVLYWDAVSSITSIGESKVASDSPALQRGQALILNRQAATSTTIYIVGQYTSASAPSVTISPGYNLLAPPATSGSTVLNNLSWTNAVDGVGAVNGDIIVTKDMTKYRWNGTNWVTTIYYPATLGFSETSATITIPYGEGFWYHRDPKISTASFDLNWSTAQ